MVPIHWRVDLPTAKDQTRKFSASSSLVTGPSQNSYKRNKRLIFFIFWVFCYKLTALRAPAMVWPVMAVVGGKMPYTNAWSWLLQLPGFNPFTAATQIFLTKKCMQRPVHRTFPGPVTSLCPQHCAFWCQSFLVLKDVTLCILTQILPHAKSYRISNFTFCCCLADGAHPHMSAKGLNTKEPRNEPNWGWWGGRGGWVEDKTASDLLHSLTCSPLAERMLLLSELNPSVRTSLRWPFLWMLEVSKHLTLCASTSCTSAISTVLLLRSAATWHGNQQQTHFQKERKKRIRYSMNFIVWITKWKVMTTLTHPPHR